MKEVNVKEIWEYDKDYQNDEENGIYRAEVELGEYGIIRVCYSLEQIKLVVGKNNLQDNEIKNAIGVLVLRDYDSLIKVPKINEASPLLQELYNEICESESGMLFITEDDWQECYIEDYTDKDIETLKEEVKKYCLADVIQFNVEECKIMVYTDLELRFRR